MLRKKVEKVNITNKSVIDADFYAFTKNEKSIFKPVQKHYVLKPEQRYSSQPFEFIFFDPDLK